MFNNIYDVILNISFNPDMGDLSFHSKLDLWKKSYYFDKIAVKVFQNAVILFQFAVKLFQFAVKLF